MAQKLLTLLAIALTAGILSSCRLFNPSVMLRTKKNYPYSEGVDSLPTEYIIQKGDILDFRLYSNQGFKIIDLTTIEEGGRPGQSFNSQSSFPYLVESDSSVNLPIIGRIMIAGNNLREAEDLLETEYRNYYNEPFVQVRVQNRRITVFPGQGGSAKVVDIENQYITIVEALALAGGITTGGKAHKVKVIRGKLKEPEVYKIDMSTIKGLAEANTHYVRANDIIYVEPSYFVGKQTLTTTTQILGLVSNILLTYVLIATFNQRF